MHSDLLEEIREIYYRIWNTPNFKKQKALVDEILQEIPVEFQNLLLHHVIVNFDKIETDRKDKFYYLIKKIIQDNEQTTLEYILNIKSTDALGYILTIINEENKKIISKWDDKLFIEFISKCKPLFLPMISEDFKFEEEVLKKYIEMPIDQLNREKLYKFMK